MHLNSVNKETKAQFFFFFFFDNHWNAHLFLEKFYKEMLISFTLLLIDIKIKPHIDINKSNTSQSINLSNY